jgi:predicted nucleotidyltransferase
LETLESLSKKYNFDEAYIFGSLVKKGHYRENSDIDIGVKGLEYKYFFSFMGELITSLGREIDLVRIEGTKLAKKIKEGILWKREH